MIQESFTHISSAATDEYQQFILTISKALLAFGSPSHRIEAQLNSLAKVFEIEAQFNHTTGTIQVSFGDPESRTAETCIIKSPVGLALGRINAVHNIYRSVLRDEMYASDATDELRALLAAPPRYGLKSRLVLAFLTSGLISGIAFGGSLNDMWVAGILGVIVRLGQNYASKSDLSASGSEYVPLFPSSSLTPTNLDGYSQSFYRSPGFVCCSWIQYLSYPNLVFYCYFILQRNFYVTRIFDL